MYLIYNTLQPEGRKLYVRGAICLPLCVYIPSLITENKGKSFHLRDGELEPSTNTIYGKSGHTILIASLYTTQKMYRLYVCVMARSIAQLNRLRFFFFVQHKRKNFDFLLSY